MRIEWGSGAERADVASLAPRPCPRCASQQPFTLRLQYKYRYLGDPALCWVSGRQYAEVCDRCGGGAAVDRRATEQSLTAVPIPWQRRYGMAIGGAGIAAVTLAVLLLIQLSQKP